MLFPTHFDSAGKHMHCAVAEGPFVPENFLRGFMGQQHSANCEAHNETWVKCFVKTSGRLLCTFVEMLLRILPPFSDLCFFPIFASCRVFL